MQSQPPLPSSSSTYHMIADRLREQILSGRYTPGQHLVQDDLALEFGISRTPIREALTFLAREGLVTLLPNRGAIVTRFSSENLVEVYTVRIALESHATYLAARHMNEQRITDLTAQMEAMGAALADQDLEGLFQAHNRFHLMIYQAAGRPRLFDLIQRYIAQATAYIRLSLTVGRGATDPIREHKDLVQILKYQDSDGAGSLMRNHLETTLVELEEILQGQQSSTPPD